MSYISEWLTLSEAIKHIENAGEPEPPETLRRACADGNIGARGLVDGSYRELGPEWWHPSAQVEFAAGRIVKGPTSKSLPIRTLRHKGDQLGPGDYQSIPVKGNLADAVEVSRGDVERIWPPVGAGGSVSTSADTTDPQSRTFDPAVYETVLSHLQSGNKREENVCDLSAWALADALTMEQAACLWAGVDPSTSKFFRPASEASRIAPILQMLSAAIQTGELHADSSRNAMATIGDYSKSLTRVGDLRNFARSKRQRPAFLFDTLLPDNAEEDVTPQDSSAPAKSKGGRPAEYDWDAFTIEIIRVANSIDGLPEKQSELIDQMLQWCENTWGQQPSLTSVKNRISQIYNGLGLGQKPTTP